MHTHLSTRSVLFSHVALAGRFYAKNRKFKNPFHRCKESTWKKCHKSLQILPYHNLFDSDWISFYHFSNKNGEQLDFTNFTSFAPLWSWKILTVHHLIGFSDAISLKRALQIFAITFLFWTSKWSMIKMNCKL